MIVARVRPSRTGGGAFAASACTGAIGRSRAAARLATESERQRVTFLCSTIVALEWVVIDLRGADPEQAGSVRSG